MLLVSSPPYCFHLCLILVPANEVEGTYYNDVVDRHCEKRHYLVSCVKYSYACVFCDM